MELRCGDCQAVIQIPDERVPQSGTFRLNCPRCKRKIHGSVKASGNREGGPDSPWPAHESSRKDRTAQR